MRNTKNSSRTPMVRQEKQMTSNAELCFLLAVSLNKRLDGELSSISSYNLILYIYSCFIRSHKKSVVPMTTQKTQTCIANL